MTDGHRMNFTPQSAYRRNVLHKLLSDWLCMSREALCVIEKKILPLDRRLVFNVLQPLSLLLGKPAVGDTNLVPDSGPRNFAATSFAHLS
jgi:hypothetical protein